MDDLSIKKSGLIALMVTLVLTMLSVSSQGGIPNSDDLLRLVTVRDLLAGQNWFDLNQYRLGLDTGTLMHWSRLVDAPIAAIYVLAEALTGSTGAAEQAARIIWPAFTLFMAFMAVLYACKRLDRPDMAGPSTIVAAVAFLTIGIFGTGALDHHSIQVALGLWLIALLLPNKRAELPHAIAAVIAVLMLAIGIETLPYVTVAGLWVALGFVSGVVQWRAARNFGLWLGISSLMVFALTVSPSVYGAVYCDAYSSFHIGMCAIGGFGLAITAQSFSTPKTRFAGLALTGCMAGAALLVLFPSCLQNPLATLDPKLKIFWLDGVVETRSIFDLLASDPFALAGMFGMASFALLVCFHLTMRRDGQQREVALLSALMLVTAIAVTAWQQRGMMFAAAFSILPLSLVLSEIRMRYTHGKKISDLFAMVCFGVLSLNMTWWIIGANAATVLSDKPTLQQQIASATPRDYCYGQDVYADLAKEPKGVVLGATDIGASILTYTHHRALAGPYHRNTKGNLVMIEAMLATPVDAEKLIRNAGVTLIADCVNSADAVDFKKAAPDGLQSLLHKGEIPNWLTPVQTSTNAPLVLYRVNP